MKKGRTIQEMAAEIQRQHDSKRDFVAGGKTVLMEPDGQTIGLYPGPVGDEFRRLISKPVTPAVFQGPATRLAHTQLAEKLGIPQKYYDKMQAATPDLLAANVNRWLAENPKERMFRTLDNNVRAVLFSGYRPLDNIDLSRVFLPMVRDMDLNIISCEITEQRLYFKALCERITAEVEVGDTVQSGIVISNSEVGCGKLKVEPLVYRLSCLNGAISQAALAKYHVGKRVDSEDGAREFFKDETREADDKAFWLKVRDIVAASLDQSKFDRIVEKWREAKGHEFETKVDKVVEVTAKKYDMTGDEQDDVLKYLIDGGNLNQFGLGNAITRMSQDVGDYDRATDFERAGGTILELPRQEWESLNKEAAKAA